MILEICSLVWVLSFLFSSCKIPGGGGKTGKTVFRDDVSLSQF